MRNSIVRRRFLRRATAAVEAAVMAPVVATCMLGMVEVGYSFMIRQTVTLSAREGARAASLPGGTMSDVNSAVDAAMASAKLEGYTTTSNVSELGPDDKEVWVKVSIPFDRANFTGTLFGGGSFNIQATCTMRREGFEDNEANGIEM